MKIKVLDKGSLGDDLSVEALSKFGEVLVYQTSTPEELTERIRDAEVAVVNKLKFTRQILSHAERLKLICIFATGYDNIDISACKERGIAVCNVPGYSTESVCLFTVATVLNLLTHLTSYMAYVNSGEYTESGVANRLTPPYSELKGKTWGIVGYGNIGKAVGRVASAFGCKIIYNRRTPSSDEGAVDIDTLCSESDIITLHCPLNDGTRNLIDKDKLSLMKKSCILVNEARGAVVDSEAVAEAVLHGELAGFGSDVYDQEPFDKCHPYNKLLGLDNVILTPHAAWGAYEARERCLNIICDNIASFESGKTLNRVDI